MENSHLKFPQGPKVFIQSDRQKTQKDSIYNYMKKVGLEKMEPTDVFN